MGPFFFYFQVVHTCTGAACEETRRIPEREPIKRCQAVYCLHPFPEEEEEPMDCWLDVKNKKKTFGKRIPSYYLSILMVAKVCVCCYPNQVLESE